MQTIILDTLGKLYAHGHGLVGWCLDCAGRYRPATPASEKVRSSFDVDMATFIAERGADAAISGLQPPPCPRCGSARTEIRYLTGGPEMFRRRDRSPAPAVDVAEGKMDQVQMLRIRDRLQTIEDELIEAKLDEFMVPATPARSYGARWRAPGKSMARSRHRRDTLENPPRKGRRNGPSHTLVAPSLGAPGRVQRACMRSGAVGCEAVSAPNRDPNRLRFNTLIR
jgi:hypothetical protein